MNNEFDWNETIQLCMELKSKYLLEDSTFFEAASRTIVNRSYYSAFRLATVHLIKNYGYSYNPESIKSHDDLINKIYQISRARENMYSHVKYHDYEDISNKLKRLKILRKQVDYDETPLHLPKIIASNSLAISQEIINLIKIAQTDIERSKK